MQFPIMMSGCSAAWDGWKSVSPGRKLPWVLDLLLVHLLSFYLMLRIQREMHMSFTLYNKMDCKQCVSGIGIFKYKLDYPVNLWKETDFGLLSWLTTTIADKQPLTLLSTLNPPLEHLHLRWEVPCSSPGWGDDISDSARLAISWWVEAVATLLTNF